MKKIDRVRIWVRCAVEDVWYFLLDILPIIIFLGILGVVLLFALYKIEQYNKFAIDVADRCLRAGYDGAIRVDGARSSRIYFFCFSGDPVEYHPVPGIKE